MSGVFEAMPRGIYLKVYADDITLIVIGVHPKAIRKKAQAAKTAVGKWAAKAGFDISAAKSTRLHICASNHQPPRKPITINQEVIPTRKTLDRHLTLQAHFDLVKKSCENRLKLLRNISGRTTRCDRSTHLRVANAVIGSRLTYGIDFTCRAQDQLIKALPPMHNRAIRTISGLLPSTPANAACAEAGVLPFRHKVALTTCNRKYPGQRTRLLPCRASQRHASPGGRSPPARAKKLAYFLERLRSRYHDWAIRYTDGSKLGDRVGVGVHGTEPEQHYRIPPGCSVFSAEAAGIFQATIAPRDRAALIITDSNSAIFAIENPKSKHPFIQGIQAALDSAEHRTVLMWVLGHCGIQGNERADILADIGRNSPFLTPKIPADDAEKMDQGHHLAIRVQRVEAGPNPVFFRKANPTARPGEDLPNRRDQTVLSRLRTGHTRASHNIVANNSGFRRQCEICSAQYSVEHFLCVCPALEHIRQIHQITDIPSSLANDKVRKRQLFFLSTTYPHRILNVWMLLQQVQKCAWLVASLDEQGSAACYAAASWKGKT
ncbi:uncharacterized protein LOC134288908 [Aedes albopictus]|uniref:RNase H type-1 domain-containing protein n=1 Tax=Aedes albopictus TaxID=7160 RepID=A0ABM1Z7X9_AEDAL